MPESPTGRSLRHYLLSERLGAGGMGEVYKAEDRHGGRIVAVKLLLPAFAENPERIARFEREARIASALKHPHIAEVYEVGREGSVHFIAMEYVEGQGLSLWLERRRPSLPEVLRVMEQVGDALARAHQSGVLHRDLKPSNVLVTALGEAKLLDFGLAKMSGEAETDPDASTQAHLTRTGMVMGTMAYMSPEQAKGHAMDRRSDVFSFGILLFETVAGIHPFPASAGLEAAAGVLRDDPIPLLRGRAGVPRELVRVIAKALEKDPARRYQYMDDLVVDLSAARLVLESGPTPDARPPAGAGGWRWLLAGLALGGALAAVADSLARVRGAGAGGGPPPIARPGLRVWPLTAAGLNQQPWISAEGDRVVYSTDRFGSFDIVLQEVGTGRLLRLTEDPGDEFEPALSPDGQTVAFSTGDGRIRTVGVAGGPARVLAEGGAAGPVWSPNGRRLAFRSGPELFAVDPRVGSPRRLMDGNRMALAMRPAWSPDGKWLFFPSAREGRYVLARVAAEGGRAEVVGGEMQALGSPFWPRGGSWMVGGMGPPREPNDEIWALRIEPARGRAGDPVRILAGVVQYESPTISRDGRTIAFEVMGIETFVARIPLRGGERPSTPVRLSASVRCYDAAVHPQGSTVVVVTDRGGRQMMWKLAPDGLLEPFREGTGEDEHPAFSPDGLQLAFSHIEGGGRRIAVMSSSGGPLTHVSEQGMLALDPAWSPDGRFIAFGARRAEWSLRVLAASGGGARELATHSRPLRRPTWSPDGRFVVVGAQDPAGRWNLCAAPSQGGLLREVLRDARSPLWLPDGRLLFTRESYPGTLDVWSVALGADGMPVREEEPLTRLPRGQTVVDTGALTTDCRFVYFTLLARARSEIWLGEAR